MRKHNTIMLLMAMLAVMLMTIACGSSDDPTERPSTPRSGTDTSEPTSQSQNHDQDQDQTEDEDPRPPNDATEPPQVVNTPQVRGAGTSFWPTPAPTRAQPVEPTTFPTNSTPAVTPEPQVDKPTDSHPTIELTDPSYDGASPLIHIFFDQPWIIIPSIEGQTHKPALKGLTQNGDIVSVDDPSAWGITMEAAAHHEYRDDKTPTILVAPDGTITLQTGQPLGYEQTPDALLARLNDRTSMIRIFHDTVSDQIVLLSDLRQLPPSRTEWSRKDCAYVIAENGSYTPVYHHASASILTSGKGTLDTVREEAAKLGFELHTNPPFENANISPDPATSTNLMPPSGQCAPIETAYQLAKELNKIPGVHRLRWLNGLAFTTSGFGRKVWARRP